MGATKILSQPSVVACSCGGCVWSKFKSIIKSVNFLRRGESTCVVASSGGSAITEVSKTLVDGRFFMGVKSNPNLGAIPIRSEVLLSTESSSSIFFSDVAGEDIILSFDAGSTTELVRRGLVHMGSEVKIIVLLD